MSRGSSNKFLTTIAEEQPDDIFLHLITVDWPDNTTNRYVKNYEDVISRGNTYSASSFNVTLPEEPSDSIPSVTFQFGVGERTIVRKLREADGRPILTLELVLASDPDIVEMGPFTFDVRRYNTQGVSVSVEAGFEPYLDFAVPQFRYSPQLFPGLFKDFTTGGS